MRFFCLLCLLGWCGSLKAQSGLVITGESNLCYAGRDNVLAAAAFHCPPAQLVLTASNGSIRKDAAGNFIYRPARLSDSAVVTAYRLRGGDSVLLGSRRFRVKYLGPQSLLMSRSHTDIVRPDLLGKTGLESLDNACLDPRLVITGFDCQIRSEEDTTRALLHSGSSLFTPAMQEQFARLQVRDEVRFTNISCLGSDGIARRLADIRFLIGRTEDHDPTFKPLPHSLSSGVSSPDLVIGVTGQRTCIVGFENFLLAASPSYRNADIHLSTDNGTIRKDAAGAFRLVPFRADTTATITGYCIRGKDTLVLGRSVFLVRGLSGAFYHHHNGIAPTFFPQEMAGKERLSDLIDFMGWGWHDAPDFTLTSFVCEVKFAATQTMSEGLPAYGDRFTPAMQALFAKLRPGDRVFFDDIKVKGPDGKTRNLGTLTVIIW